MAGYEDVDVAPVLAGRHAIRYAPPPPPDRDETIARVEAAA